MNNDNVVIKTNDKEAKRKILEVIEDHIGVTILLTEEPLQLQASIYNDTIIEIIRRIIMEDMLEVVSMYPLKAKEKQENKNDKENITTKTVEKRKVETAKKTIKERIFSYMLSKEQVTNAEVIKELQLRADQVNQELTALYKCGKIEKIGRGQWKIKNTQENHVLGSKQDQQEIAKVEEPVKEEQTLVKETKEITENLKQKKNPNSQEKLQKEIYNFIRGKQQVKNKEIIEKFALEDWRVSNILKNLEEEGKIQKLGYGTWKANQTLEQQILDLLAKGWQMTKKEIAEKTGLEDMEDLEELLNSMEKDKKITKEEDNYKIWKSQFGIFDIEENKVLLDYIMEHPNFTTSQIKSKFPEEYSKLPKLLEELEKKYVSPRKDTIGGYVVHNKGRILYFIMKHPDTTFSTIKEYFQLIKSQDISNAINIAVRNGELERNKYGGYHTLKM